MSEGSNSAGMLRSFVARIERLKAEQDDLAADIRDVYAEAKAAGFDKTALGQVVSIRRKREKDAAKFEEQSAIVELYLATLDGDEPVPASHAHTREEPKKTKGAKSAPTNTAPVVSSLSPATVGQGDHADDARSDASSLDGTAVLLPRQSSEAGPEAGGEAGRNASPQRPSLNDIAGDYRPTPVRRVVDEEEGIPEFLRRA